VLSYRHGFHAGNHADVLKHVVLVNCIARLAQKDKALWYIDTHAGAGSYELATGFAAQNREWSGGIERLAALAREESPPTAIAAYLSLVGKLASGGTDTAGNVPEGTAVGGVYPGSPAIAAALLRAQDRLALFELHPNDCAPLQSLFADDRRALVRKADGFAGLRSLLPPPSRRALVLVDPSYELGEDYERVVDAVGDALRRFATGVYAVWYPLLERDDARRLPGRLCDLVEKSLDIVVRVRSSLPGERGMSGSGLVILNPPWLLEETMAEALPYLVRALGEDGGAAWSLRGRGLSQPATS
jgi:23S rRNA (adenine2030-N6)-methyltransferase